MSSLLIGNLQCFFMFQGEEYITSATRNTLGVILIVVSGLGTALMFGLRPPPSQSQDEVFLIAQTNLHSHWFQAVNPTASKEEVPSVVESLKASMALFRTPDMMAFSFTLFYTGLHLTLWDGLFSTCIGFTGG